MGNIGKQGGPSAPVHLLDINNQAVLNDYFMAVARGLVSGQSHVNIFGEATNIDIADGYVDIWDGTGNANAAKTYTYSATDDIDSLSSSDAGDNTQTIEVQGLDVDFVEVTQNIALNGQTRVALTTPLIRVFQMRNLGFGDLAGDVYCYVNGAITGGIPDTNADVRAIIAGANNHTAMGLYTIPAGKTGYVTGFSASTGLTIAGISSVRLFTRPFGQVFQLSHTDNIDTNASSHLQRTFAPPKVFSAKTDIVKRANTSADDNGVSASFDLILIDD